MHRIQHRVRIAAPIASLQSLVVSAAGFARWWSEDCEELDEGRVRLGFFSRATVYDFVRVADTPEHAVAWICRSGGQWNTTEIRFSSMPGDGVTDVVFTHSGWAEETDYFYGCNTVWGGLMFRLKAEAEGHPLGPYFARSGTAY